MSPGSILLRLKLRKLLVFVLVLSMMAVGWLSSICKEEKEASRTNIYLVPAACRCRVAPPLEDQLTLDGLLMLGSRLLRSEWASKRTTTGSGALIASSEGVTSRPSNHQSSLDGTSALNARRSKHGVEISEALDEGTDCAGRGSDLAARPGDGGTETNETRPGNNDGD